MFYNFDESVKSKVTLGIDNKISITSKVNINILNKKGGGKYISDAYFVPSLKHNVIRIRQLMLKGYNVFFKNGECTIIDKFPSKQLIENFQMTTNRMLPLRIKHDLMVELPQAQSSMNPQEDDGKNAAITEATFHVEIKYENWL